MNVKFNNHGTDLSISLEAENDAERVLLALFSARNISIYTRIAMSSESENDKNGLTKVCFYFLENS